MSGGERTLALGERPFADRTGRGVRVAIVDSGVASGHPHVGVVQGGIWLTPDGAREAWHDEIGHGTAVAGAIREKAPESELLSVRVFGRRLATSADLLVQGIAWACAHGARLVNLSLGTDNPVHEGRLSAAIEEGARYGAIVVAAAPQDGRDWILGRLPGVVAVSPESGLGRDHLRLEIDARWHPLGVALACSPYPRPIEGVPVERNLAGGSFAVANATGFLARLLEGRRDITSAAALFAALTATRADETATNA